MMITRLMLQEANLSKSAKTYTLIVDGKLLWCPKSTRAKLLDEGFEQAEFIDNTTALPDNDEYQDSSIEQSGKLTDCMGTIQELDARAFAKLMSKGKTAKVAALVSDKMAKNDHQDLLTEFGISDSDWDSL